jgi:hypothetical protein
MEQQAVIERIASGIDGGDEMGEAWRQLGRELEGLGGD